jgi:hypothetical protein
MQGKGHAFDKDASINKYGLSKEVVKELQGENDSIYRPLYTAIFGQVKQLVMN